MARAQITSTTQYNARQGVSITKELHVQLICHYILPLATEKARTNHTLLCSVEFALSKSLILQSSS